MRTARRTPFRLGPPNCQFATLVVIVWCWCCLCRSVCNSCCGCLVLVLLVPVSLQLLLWLFDVGAVGAGQFATLVVVV